MRDIVYCIESLVLFIKNILDEYAAYNYITYLNNFNYSK